MASRSARKIHERQRFTLPARVESGARGGVTEEGSRSVLQPRRRHGEAGVGAAVRGAVAASTDDQLCYCFSGTVIGFPLSATMTASTLAGSVWLAFAETACNWPGASWNVSPLFSTRSAPWSTLIL
jgi:hypothetical protein